MAERADTRALGASCSSPVAAFCVLEDGDLRMRAQLFSEDGRDMVEERAAFDCDDLKTPVELAHAMLAEVGTRSGACSPRDEAAAGPAPRAERKRHG